MAVELRKIVICDVNQDVVDAVYSEMEHEPLPLISTSVGSILDQDVEAVVAPANSFGFMDGGIDLVYSLFFGWHVQDRLRGAIKARPMGELLVGEAIAIATDHPKIPWLISAPTMRFPTRITDPTDIMLACRAATLVAIERNLRSVAFPGMGTGCGAVPPSIAVRNMLTGIHKGMSRPREPGTWRHVAEEHSILARV